MGDRAHHEKFLGWRGFMCGGSGRESGMGGGVQERYAWTWMWEGGLNAGKI